MVDGVHFGEHTCVVALGIEKLPERLKSVTEKRMRPAGRCLLAVGVLARAVQEGLRCHPPF
ncbi:MAG TPA: hypothetical protein VIY52_30610 [Streptosporangiaceae bacterium]